ncbi:MAG: OB-fold nucleic acid binding domain-containing protein [Nanoarchaeota archaeon]
MIKIPKELIIQKLKEKANLTDKEIVSRVKDKLDKLSGLISEDGALHIIANELGVKILEDPGELQVKNVLAGMRNVELTGKVVKIYEIREFDKNNRKGKVGNFLIGDETGVIRVVAWNDKADLLSKLSEGSVVKIEGGYSRDNRGKPEIHLGDKTKVTIQENAGNIEVKEKTNERKRISELNENDTNVEIMGTIVQVFDPKFFTVDPESGRKVVEKDGSFFLGDKLVDNPDYSYVTNLFLDDGTENIRVVLWKNQTQHLLGKNHEEILARKENGFEEEKNELLGKIVKFTGRTNKNEMFDRVEFIVQIVDVNPNPEEEIKRLSKKIDEQPEAVAEESAEEPNESQEVIEETRVNEVKKPKQKSVKKSGYMEEIVELEITQEEPAEEPEEIVEEFESEKIQRQPFKNNKKPVSDELEEIDEIDDLMDLDSI